MDTNTTATAETDKQNKQDKIAAACKAWNDKLPKCDLTEEQKRDAYVASMTDYLSRSPESAMD